ncbi:hypothetical protein ZY50_22540 [Salmonella enterica subsp. enterica]|nr:hypothetical protein [Salmonella enterica subsp. enterica serovar Newport]EAB5694154.1 hypothetical protein [Salmonella enterica subsp. enterica serovar Newport]EBU6996608.1 hypothetical protein [Salmonella enterica subsp. enterica serovar Newport]EEB7956811.1 hypothetical protein [Salmonella enterica subsp. enterica serovar Newport]
MWLMSMAFAMLFITASLFIDLAVFNTKMHRDADNNQAYLFLKNIHEAVSLLKNDPQIINNSGHCLDNTESETYISAECIDYGMNGGFSVRGKNSPLYMGNEKWAFRHIGGVIKHKIATQSYYYIYINKGEKVNHAVYSLIPQDKYTIVGFYNNVKNEIEKLPGVSACSVNNYGGMAPCSSVPAGVPKDALVVVL